MKELAFVFINPYTIAKSRTGGIIARYLARTDADLVAARMFGPSKELVREYANLVRHAEPASETCELIGDYIERCYAPDQATGKPRRMMLLLFEGEDAVKQIWQVTGSATLRTGSGETIRDTYGDYILDENGKMRYFEPAVLVGPTVKRVAATLTLWARYSESDGGIVESAADVPSGERVEKTLVLLKPDSFRHRSLRAGNIIDLLSLSGLRIVAVNKFSMTVEQAERFYGPVKSVLQAKFRDIGYSRVTSALEREFGFRVPQQSADAICRELSATFANDQFDRIVEFMTGYKPSDCSELEKNYLANEECFGLVYEGVNAVEKIRAILGPTDPKKAKPGSVRHEFGSDVMVNAAHASDSPENARREMEIVRIEKDRVTDYVNRYYGGALSRRGATDGQSLRVETSVSRKTGKGLNQEQKESA